MMNLNDVNRSLRNIHSFLSLKYALIGSFLNRDDSSLDSTEKAKYRAIIKDIDELLRKIENTIPSV